MDDIPDANWTEEEIKQHNANMEFINQLQASSKYWDDIQQALQEVELGEVEVFLFDPKSEDA